MRQYCRDAGKIGRLNAVSFHLPYSDRRKRRGFEPALTNRWITSQISPTFQPHIFTASLPSTTRARDRLEHEGLIKRYIPTKELSSPSSTPCEDASG